MAATNLTYLDLVLHFKCATTDIIFENGPQGSSDLAKVIDIPASMTQSTYNRETFSRSGEENS